MRIACVADVHLGNHRLHGGQLIAGVNNRARLVLDTLRAALRIAEEDEKCDAFIVNGDLWDVSKPSPQLITAAQQVLSERSIKKYILLGNHDMESAAEGDHALGPLRHLATIVEKPQKILIAKTTRGFVDAVELWAVPFRPGAAADWLPSVLAEVQGFPVPGSPASPTRVLALHLGLQEDTTAPWLLGAHDSIRIDLLQKLMSKFGLDATYAGNWHDPKQWTWHDSDRSVTQPMRAVQIGTLCPTGWDNPGLEYGTMAIFDSQKESNCKVVRIPGPRFLSTTEEAEKALKAGCLPFLRLKVDSEGLDEANATAEKLTKIGCAVEVLADSGEAQAALRQAVGLARSAESVDESVTAYVNTMPLEVPELRPLVLEKVRRYLGGAE